MFQKILLLLAFQSLACPLLAIEEFDMEKIKLDEATEVFCRSDEYKFDLIGTYYTGQVLNVVVYDRESKSHQMYFMHQMLLSSHIQLSSMYLKNAVRVSMMELFGYDPAINSSLMIQTIRSVDVPKNTVDYQDGFLRTIIMTYDNARFVEQVKFTRQEDVFPVLERINVTGDISRLRQEFVLDPNSLGFQIWQDPKTSEWYINDMEEYDAKVWPIGPINRIGFITNQQIKFLALLPVIVKKPHDFVPINANKILGFIEPSTKRIVLFVDNLVYVLRDVVSGIRHNFAYIMVYEHYDFKQFFTCTSHPNHAIYGGINYVGNSRLNIVYSLFWGIVGMACVILCYAIYKAIIWHSLLDVINRKKERSKKHRRKRVGSVLEKKCSRSGSRLAMRSLPQRSEPDV